MRMRMPPRDTEGRPRRKERRRLLAESLPMARRRAYRASQEALDQGMHLWKTADNKARFALMLLGPLNAVLLVLLSNTDLFRDIPSRERIPIVAGIVTYAALATAMFLLAIGTLR